LNGSQGGCGDLLRGARDGQAIEFAEQRGARAWHGREALDPHQEWQKPDVTKRDGVACGRQDFDGRRRNA
jgi:hypothetical protein